jgi:hypothetical protein
MAYKTKRRLRSPTLGFCANGVPKNLTVIENRQRATLGAMRSKHAVFRERWSDRKLLRNVYLLFLIYVTQEIHERTYEEDYCTTDGPPHVIGSGFGVAGVADEEVKLVNPKDQRSQTNHYGQNIFDFHSSTSGLGYEGQGKSQVVFAGMLTPGTARKQVFALWLRRV